MTINEMVVDTFSNCKTGDTFSTAEIIDKVVSKYGINRKSFQPSDMCYNISNKGVEKGLYPNTKIFLWLKRGYYKYVGTKYSEDML